MFNIANHGDNYIKLGNVGKNNWRAVKKKIYLFLTVIFTYPTGRQIKQMHSRSPVFRLLFFNSSLYNI